MQGTEQGLQVLTVDLFSLRGALRKGMGPAQRGAGPCFPKEPSQNGDLPVPEQLRAKAAVRLTGQVSGACWGL